MSKKSLILTAAAFLVSLAPLAPMAQAADKPVIGTKVLLRDPVDPSGRRFRFVTRDPNITFGSNGDTDTPSLNGASLLIFNHVSEECQCIVLPASNWSIGNEGKRWVYRDQSVSSSPVKVVVLKEDKLNIFAYRSGLTSPTLDETSQGQIAVHFTSGTGSKLCALFDGLSIRRDETGFFIARKAVAPVACATEPAACTPCVPPIAP